MKLPKDKVLKYVSPMSDVSSETTQEIQKLIIKHLEAKEDDIKEIMRAVGVECVNKQGTYIKRIVKELKKYKHSLSPKVLSTIGNIIGVKADKNQTHYFDIYSVDKNKWWNSDEFGQSGGSCYWSDGRKRFLVGQKPSFHALRFFTENSEIEKLTDCPSDDIMHGHSRSWLRNYDDYLILFNGYGAPLLRQARILSMYLGQSYEEAFITNDGETDGQLFINNGGRSYIVAPQEVIDEKRKSNHIKNDVGTSVFSLDFDVEACSEPDHYCSRCEDAVDEDDVCWMDDTPYCSSCFDEETCEDYRGVRYHKDDCNWSTALECWIESGAAVYNETVEDYFIAKKSELINKEYYPSELITRKADGSTWYQDECLVEAEKEAVG